MARSLLSQVQPMKAFFESLKRKKAEPAQAAVTPAGLVTAEPPAASVPTASLEKDVVMLEFGDFLSRLPKNLLKHGALDLKTPVPVEVSELARCLAQGRSTVTVA